MMRISYKLTKRTKIEKYKKSLKTDRIKNCITIRYKLTALSNIIQNVSKPLKKLVKNFLT